MEEKKARSDRRKNGFSRFIAFIYILAAAAFFYYVFKLDVVPAKYLYAGIGVIALITIFSLPAMVSKKGKKGRRAFATILSILLIVCFGLGTYYLASTESFLDNITRRSVPTEEFHVLVRADDMPDLSSGDSQEAAETSDDSDSEEADSKDKSKASGKLSDPSSDARAELAAQKIGGTTVGTFASNDQMYSKAKLMLQEKISVEYSYDETAYAAVENLLYGYHDSILIPAATYEAIQNEGAYDLQTNTAILYTIKVPKETVDRTKGVNVTKQPFNIYISGTDQDGARSDVNMIATVNPVKHEVLLTSIPRDLYVELPSKESMDKLTHSSIYGMEETVAAAEKEFGIDINYYVRVNYSVVRNVVDAIGGIDVESQYDFYTSGMGSLNGTHFVVGMNHMNGDQALAFCRERHSFVSGDMTRNENQQAVLEAIIKKATSSKEILRSYTSILDAVAGNLETDMSSKDMSSLIKMQLNSMPEWNIRKNAIKGDTGSDYCYSLGQYASVVYAMPDEITMAVDEIVKTQMND